MNQEMTSDKIRSIVQQELNDGQYKPSSVPYHVHNGTDSPLIPSSSTPINASGPGTNTTVGASATPTNIPIASADFSHGITYGTTAGGHLGFTILTAGQYLVIGMAFFNSPSQANKSYQTMLYKNGSEVAATFAVTPTIGLLVGMPASKIFDCAVGDYFELYAQTTSTSTETVTSGFSYLSLAKV